MVLRTGNDFALWVSASLADIRPRVVLATFHSGLGAEKALVASELSSTDSLAQSGSTGPGCSLAAITWLARQLEYLPPPPAQCFCNTLSRYLCVHVDRLGLYAVCIDNTEVGRVAGAKEHWNNPVLLWRIMEYCIPPLTSVPLLCIKRLACAGTIRIPAICRSGGGFHLRSGCCSRALRCSNVT